jgi:hypothetical protein
MFTGNVDNEVRSNDRIWNDNVNVFELLCTNDELKGQFAAFTSWDVFPYILNSQRNGLYVNSDNTLLISKKQKENGSLACFKHNTHCRNDMVTYLQAKEYLQRKQPSILYVALGETDEYAHEGDYFHYLKKANEADRIIEDLWYFIQTNNHYKNNTTLLITTDHGRGNGKQWTSHGNNIAGSSDIWFAALGNQVSALGESKQANSLYQKQIAATIANLYGAKFGTIAPIELSK